MKKIYHQLLLFLHPSAFNIGFAFLASILGLYSTAKTPECFTTCGWPIKFVTQLPKDNISVDFSIHFAALFAVWIFWYVVGCSIQQLYLRIWRNR